MPDPVDALRSHLAAVWEEREPLVARVAAEIIARVPSYSTTPSSEVWIGMNRILERIVKGDPFGEPTAEDLEAAAGTGIQGAGARIHVADLVAAVLLGAREVEDEVMRRAEDAGVPAEVRIEGSRRTRRWAEAIAVAAVRGLDQAAEPGYRDPAVGLVAGLQSGVTGAALAELAARAGLDAGGRHHVVVARSADRDTLDDVDGTRLRFAVSGAWALSGDALVGVLDRRPPAIGALVIGVAGPVPVADLSAALVEADRACRAAHARLGAGCHDLDSLGLILAVHEDAALMERLDRRWVQPLRSEPRHDLVRTVRCWQRVGQVDEVARELGVHPNTVRNRLARVDRLLPGWRGPRGQAELWAALVVADRAHPSIL